MATKRIELANPDSCLNKADDDEPIFVLRAKDPMAYGAVLDWADASEHEHAHEPEKIAEARKVAQQMRDWNRAYASKQ